MKIFLLRVIVYVFNEISKLYTTKEIDSKIFLLKGINFMFIFEKKMFKFIAMVLIFLICSVALHAKVTRVLSSFFNNSDYNALGWSYNIENEDVDKPNEIYHEKVLNSLYDRSKIVVKMNNQCSKENGTEWQTEVRRQGITLKAGVSYRVSARVKATANPGIQIRFDKIAGPYMTLKSGGTVNLNKDEEKYVSFEYTPDQDYYGVKLALLFDGPLFDTSVDSYEVYIYSVVIQAVANDNVEIPMPVDYTEDSEAKKIGVNQLGYLPKSKKIAYYAAYSWPNYETPRLWKLYNKDDMEVATGYTEYLESDAEYKKEFYVSQSYILPHMIDFSGFTETGTGYYLKVTDYTDFGAVEVEYKSQPFDISNDIYKDMADDALSYFYYNRSGIEINLGDENQHRPSGHPDDTAYYKTKKYDVNGGWYDAGDFGKYTVPGAYSVWYMLNLYEQYGYNVNGLIPEDVGGENGINDLLDEAKYELDFLFKMQIPEEGLDGAGEMAGAVFHKMHDSKWTSLPNMPYNYDMDDPHKWYESPSRYLYRPTLTATLDFIAVMAQAARIWKDIDAGFSDKCLTAATNAYASLDELLLDIDGNLWTSNKKEDNGGGGPYDDVDYRDEMYWALIELYITTGESQYITSSRFTDLGVDTEGDYYGFKEIRRNTAGVEDGKEDLPHGWKNVSGCGVLSLYANKDKIDNPEMISAVEGAITALADKMHENATVINPFGIAFSKHSDVVWGSNQQVINRALIQSCAYKITDDEKYLEGVSRAMDYLLGTNPLSFSYITGYGERSPKYPHHRFFANHIDPGIPHTVPAGCLVGGPNPTQNENFGETEENGTGKDDIVLKNQDPFAILGKIYKHDYNYLSAYADSYDSFSTNEVTIYWNASLVCIAAIVDNLDALKEIGEEGGLSELDMGDMILTPDFSSDVLNYSSIVDFDVDTFQLTPTSFDNNSIIYVNGQVVTSGQPSQTINLNVGDNLVSILVEMQDGTSITYAIYITRQSENPNIILTNPNTDIRNYTVNDELTFQILTGGSGVIQIDSVVPYPSQVSVSINGGDYQPTPEQWGGPFYVPANSNVIFKVKVSVPTDIVLNWW